MEETKSENCVHPIGASTVQLENAHETTRDLKFGVIVSKEY